MARWRTFALHAAAAGLAVAGSAAAGPVTVGQALERGDVQRVLFLGDSITFDGRYVADFESWLIARYPERKFEVIDVGLPSETVSGLSEEGHAGGRFERPCILDRVANVLDKTNPDLVFACYGMNCGIYKPFDEERSARFRDGMTRLHDAVVRTGARIVHVTPPVYDPEHAGDSATEYDGVLSRYSEWLVSKRGDGWEVVDLHGPMARALEERRATDPGFAFADDGVHPGDAGHWFMARQLIAYCEGKEVAGAGAEILGERAALVPLVTERMQIMRGAWLTYTGYHHPDIPQGLPMDEAVGKCTPLTARIDALARGK